MGFTPIDEYAVRSTINLLSPRRTTRRNAWIAIHAILHRCRRTEGYVEDLHLLRGQFPYGEQELAEACYLTYQEMRTIIKSLRGIGFISVDPGNKGTIGTVLNFDDFVISKQVEPVPPTEFETAKVVEAGDYNPMTKADSLLLDPLPDFDLDDLFAHYLEQKKRYRRTRYQDIEVRRAIQVLHCDPAMIERLGMDELRKIITQWMRSDQPWNCAGLWKPNSKFDNIANWEVNLRLYERLQAQEENTDGLNTGRFSRRDTAADRDRTLDEVLARTAS